MRRTFETGNKVIEQGVLETIDYRVDQKNTTHIMYMLRNMYANPILATVRELLCNAKDAHEHIKTDKPIRVDLPSLITPVFKVRDYGPGLTDDEVKNLLFSYGSSADYKLTSDNQIGGFGIGCKAPFSVTNTFTFTVYKDGKKTVYNCFLDESDVEKAAKLLECTTDEPNGIEVCVPVSADETNLSDFKDVVTQVIFYWKTPVTVYCDGQEVEIQRFNDKYVSVPVSITVNNEKHMVEYMALLPDSNADTDGCIYPHLGLLIGELLYTVTIIDKRYDNSSTATDITDITDFFTTLAKEKGIRDIFGSRIELCHDLNTILGKYIIKVPINLLQLAPSRENLIYSIRTKKILAQLLLMFFDKDLISIVLKKQLDIADDLTKVKILINDRRCYESIGQNCYHYYNKIETDVLTQLDFYNKNLFVTCASVKKDPRKDPYIAFNNNIVKIKDAYKVVVPEYLFNVASQRNVTSSCYVAHTHVINDDKDIQTLFKTIPRNLILAPMSKNKTLYELLKDLFQYTTDLKNLDDYCSFDNYTFDNCRYFKRTASNFHTVYHQTLGMFLKLNDMYSLCKDPLKDNFQTCYMMLDNAAYATLKDVLNKECYKDALKLINVIFDDTEKDENWLADAKRIFNEKLKEKIKNYRLAKCNTTSRRRYTSNRGVQRITPLLNKNQKPVAEWSKYVYIPVHNDEIVYLPTALIKKDINSYYFGKTDSRLKKTWMIDWIENNFESYPDLLENLCEIRTTSYTILKTGVYKNKPCINLWDYCIDRIADLIKKHGEEIVRDAIPYTLVHLITLYKNMDAKGVCVSYIDSDIPILFFLYNVMKLACSKKKYANEQERSLIKKFINPSKPVKELTKLLVFIYTTCDMVIYQTFFRSDSERVDKVLCMSLHDELACRGVKMTSKNILKEMGWRLFAINDYIGLIKDIIRKSYSDKDECIQDLCQMITYCQKI